MYLMIESQGVADKESFTMLGASTARGHADKIGMFGSGATHATLVCLRHGMDVHIYSGKDRIVFFTRVEVINEEPTEVVYSQHGNRVPEQRDYSIDFGAQDWTSTDMALREYISNAIDACGWDNVRVEPAEKPRAKAGTTRIFVPLTCEVNTYFTQLRSNFLHACKKAHKTLMPNGETQAKIYRKGVFVRQIGSYRPIALFDYNCGDDLPIDESRNMDDHKAARVGAAMVGGNQDALVAIFKKFRETVEFWEASFSQYYLEGDEQTWKTAFKTAYGESGIVTSLGIMKSTLEAKGYNVCVVNESWYNAAKSHGLPVDIEAMNHVEQQGGQMTVVTPAAKATLDRVWNWLLEAEMTNGRSKPDIECFTKSMDGGAVLKGHYRRNTVFINVDNDTDNQTMLEEVAHHVTGSTDNSRDFQDFAFQLATRLAEVVF